MDPSRSISSLAADERRMDAGRIGGQPVSRTNRISESSVFLSLYLNPLYRNGIVSVWEWKDEERGGGCSLFPKHIGCR